jgi:catechol 2,3-dioxygenase-like lactoylglutathione lyase family enzyme
MTRGSYPVSLRYLGFAAARQLRKQKGRRLVLTLGVVVLGVTDRRRAQEFWCAALGYQVRDDGFGGWARVLVPPGGTGTKIALQNSETPPGDYPRLHFDLHVADAAEQRAEAARLLSLGASLVDWESYPDDPDFIVLADPEGNRFCIVDLGHEDI